METRSDLKGPSEYFPIENGWSSPMGSRFLTHLQYELERRKFARDLIKFDHKLSTLYSEKPRIGGGDSGVSHEIERCVIQKSSELPWLITNSVMNTSDGFASGIGIHYASSAITNEIHQQCAPHLIIGERMPPQIFVRAADARPYEIQDMLPSDTRFKLLFFVGYLTEERVRELNALSDQMRRPSCFLQKYGYPTEGTAQSMFSIITIMSGDKEDVDYIRVPTLLRPHWCKYVLPIFTLRLWPIYLYSVLLDDTNVTRKLGGGAYERFGIDPMGVTLVIVRPDGYIGMIAPASKLEDVDSYFATFTIPQKVVLGTPSELSHTSSWESDVSRTCTVAKM
jgi:phenol 2-monooxygenase